MDMDIITALGGMGIGLFFLFIGLNVFQVVINILLVLTRKLLWVVAAVIVMFVLLSI